MKKRKVKQFFVLFLSFVVLLVILQSIRFGGFSGFVVFNETGTEVWNYNEGIGIRILDYTRLADELDVDFALRNYDDIRKEINVKFELVDENGAVASSGKKEIILKALGEEVYVLKVDLPKGASGSFLLIVAATSDDNLVNAEARKEIYLSNAKLTGVVVSEENKRTLSWAGIVF